jgi:hypothetical protein
VSSQAPDLPARLWAYLRLKPGQPAAGQAPALWSLVLDAAKPATWSQPLGLAEFLDRFAPHARASSHLMARLQGCAEVWLLAATIGPGPECLAAWHFHKRQFLAGYLVDRMASWLVEQTMRGLAEDTAKIRRQAGLSPVARYSPGYHDFSLEAQRTFAALAGPHIPITLTRSCMLDPQKSITAVMGAAARGPGRP